MDLRLGWCLLFVARFCILVVSAEILPAEGTEMLQEKLVGDWFSVDDGTEFWGYHIPSQRWNGFACPSFPLAEVVRIAELVNGWIDEGDSCERIVVDGQRVWSVWQDGDEYDKQEIVPHVVDGVKVYPVGSHGWVWCERQTEEDGF